MPNDTYGSVRGRKTKVGGKLNYFCFPTIRFSNIFDEVPYTRLKA